MEKNYILNRQTIDKKLRRMAYEILENNYNEDSLTLIGIRDNGSVIAEHIQQLLKEISAIPTTLLHISLNKKQPGNIELSGEAEFKDKVVIVIDDVANSGKTMLYSMQPLLQYYPRKIQTLALVERTHKLYPVHNDYVGLSVATTLHEHIYVEVQDNIVSGAWME